MPDEIVFTVEGAKASEAEAISLADAGLRERAHLQEWVAEHPQILGPEVAIVTLEFGSWVTSKGEREADRLDVLGLDASGQPVVAELKRGEAPDTVEMQAIKYAAMVSRFNTQTLAKEHARYLSRMSGNAVSDDDALQLLTTHAPDLSDETLALPRVVLLASGFSPIVTTSAVFLREVGLDITLTRFQAYRTSIGAIVLTVSQLLPLPEIEDFTVSPGVVEQRRRSTEGRREARTVARLIAAGAFADGTQLRFRSWLGSGPDGKALDAWIENDPRRGRVTWNNNQARPLVWEADGEPYSPTGLVLHIIEEATGLRPRARRGPRWWTDATGRTLPQIAREAESEGDDEELDDGGTEG